MINENSTIQEIVDFIEEYGPTQIGEDSKSSLISHKALDNIIMKACERENVLIPDYCLNSTEEIATYVTKKYYEDKKVYLETKTWPQRKFWQRDNIWLHYYYLQLTDNSISLDKYLDCDYDTNKWTRKDIVNLMHKYGTKVLFSFCYYVDLQNNEMYESLHTNKSFAEWYRSSDADIIKSYAARMGIKATRK